MIEDSLNRYIAGVRQLQKRKGPHYDKWLRNYTRSVEEKCVKIADHYNRPRWLLGMRLWLQYEQSRRAKESHSLR